MPAALTPELEALVRRHVIDFLSRPHMVAMRPKGLVVDRDMAFSNGSHDGVILRWSRDTFDIPPGVKHGEPIHLPDLELLIRAVLEL